jgi:hypothetical protein
VAVQRWSIECYALHAIVQGKVRLAPKLPLSEASRALMQKRWEDVVTPVTGHASYMDMYKAMTAHKL